MKSFIDRHLLGLLENDFRVESLEEYASFLSLPTSTEQLLERRRRVGRALHIRRSWSTQ